MTTERPILFSTPMVRAILAGQKTETRRVVKPQDDIVWSGWPCDGDPNPKHPRRVCSAPPRGCHHVHYANGFNHQAVPCPYGSAGDLLWVRETFAATRRVDNPSVDDWVPGFDDDEDEAFDWEEVYYKATPRVGLRRWHSTPPVGQEQPHAVTYLHPSTPLVRGPAAKVKRWKPSIHMPKWAARIWLRVEEVRVERLRDITEDGARAEGVTPSDAEGASTAWGGPHRWAFMRLWASLYGDDHITAGANPWVWVVRYSVASTTGRPA